MNLRRNSREREVFLHLVDAQRSTGKDQHIVPLLDSFKDDRELDLEFFVRPLLCEYHQPPLAFAVVSEVVDLFIQLLEVWSAISKYSFSLLTIVSSGLVFPASHWCRSSVSH